MTTGNNQFLPLAIGSGANVLTPAAYAALSTLIQHGYQSGVAQSIQVNTTLRQATFVASAIAQIIANSGVDANDDGNISEFVTNLLNALYTSPALTGSPVAPTPSQFDSSTKLSTTNFVQRSLGNFQNTVQYNNTTASVPVSQAGMVIVLGGASNNLTLPPLASVPIGTSFSFFSQGGGSVINAAGGEHIGISGSSVSSFNLLGSDYATLVSHGVAWVVANGTPMLPGSSLFASSLSLNGWQKLPSGLILQWGLSSGVPPAPNTSTPTYSTVTYPIAFPNATLSVQVSPQDTYGANDQISTPLVYVGTLTNFQYGNTDLDTGIGNFRWLAIGF